MSSPLNCEPRKILAPLDEVLRWSKARDYRGHSKHDALNSPFVNALTFGLGPLQLAATQAVMRFPFNIRSLLGVPRLRNPKGIGLFAHACLDLAEVAGQFSGQGAFPGRDELIAEAEALTTWLIANASPQANPSTVLAGKFSPGHHVRVDREGLEGLGWGYHYPWRDVGFFQPAHFPNRVVTCWIGFAILRACETTGEERYLQAAREIAVFLLRNPRRLADSSEQLCLSYVPTEKIDWAVMDVSALVAAFCARLARLEGDKADPELLREAKRLVEFVADKQTDYGAWYYTWPPRDSHIRHDNYHTGIVLDCLADYMAFSGDHTYHENYREGLEYYRRHLFLESGAPRWMNDRTFPHDVHGAAAGILAFTRAARWFRMQEGNEEGAQEHLAFACRILTWTLETLYSGKGFFYYQKTRWITKRFCLMRWCNAWMCRAMAALLLEQAGTGLNPEGGIAERGR